MTCNVGGIDRTGRLVLGIALLLLGLLAPMGATVRIIVLVLGGIALATGIIRYCPANALLGINTCGKSMHQ